MGIYSMFGIFNLKVLTIREQTANKKSRKVTQYKNIKQKYNKYGIGYGRLRGRRRWGTFRWDDLIYLFDRFTIISLISLFSHLFVWCLIHVKVNLSISPTLLAFDSLALRFLPYSWPLLCLNDSRMYLPFQINAFPIMQILARYVFMGHCALSVNQKHGISLIMMQGLFAISLI